MGGLGKLRKNLTCVKRKIGEINLEPGEGIKLHEIMTMEDSNLVGNFSSKTIILETLNGWTTDNFSNLTGYDP